MNKKFLSALLCGALLTASTSTFVSCKDYDDDIKDLQAQIDANSGSIASVKSALESEVANLKSQLEAKSAEIAVLQAKDAELAGLIQAADAEHKAGIEANKQAIEKEIERAKQAEAALQAKIDNANAAIEAAKVALTAEINKKVDQSVYDAMVKDVYAKVASVSTDLAKALESIKTLEQGLKDEETARKAVAADLAEQKAALAAFKTESGEADAKLQQEIDALQALIDGKASKEELAKAVEDLEKKITDAYGAEIVTLNVFVETALRSVVFVPDFYYWGIEATELKTMNYPYYNLKEVSADKDGETNLTSTTGEKVACDPSTDATHMRYKKNMDFNILNFVANYHLNPSAANLEGAEYKLLSDDAKYTKAAAAGLSILGTKKVGGDLQVTLGVANPSKVKDIVADEMVTVFATEVTLPVAAKAQETVGKTLTVTSDYAAVKATSVDGGYILSNVYKAAGDADATTAERKTMTGVLNENACGACATKDGLHLFRTFEEAAYPQGKNVQPTTNAQAMVYYNGTLDLRRLVETHYVATDQPVKNADLEANNLVYKFELVGSIYGSNKTSEAAHAAIAEDGYTLRPQMPTTEGKQAAYGATEQDPASIDRQPVVRVSLYDTVKKQTLDYGYIRIRIAATKEVLKEEQYIDYTGSTKSFVINHGCADNTIPAYSWSNKWIDVEYDLYSKLGVSKAVFDAHYTAVKTQSYAGLDQFTLKADGTFALQTTAVGVIAESINTGMSESTTLNWNIPADDATYANLFKSVGTKTIARAIKYQSDNEYQYPSIYVLITTGEITVTDGGKASGVFAGMDEQKINEYWYAHNTTGNGKDEARINVYSPEDDKATICEPFESVLSSQFKGNQINAAAMITVTDPTTDKAFATSKLTYDLQFDAANNGKKFNGQTYTGSAHTVYTLKVSADGKTLNAWKNSELDAQAIATLEIADGSLPAGVNNTKIVYQHGVYAEDILNYVAYNKFEDSFLTAIIGINVQNACGMTLPVTENTFNERFVRPINVTDKEAAVKDAAQAKQVINLRDLVELSDWRGVMFDDHESTLDYWTYYNIKKITVRGAAAGTNINALITTNMNGSNINSTKLSEVSNLVEFEYNPITPGTPSETADYGTIVYTNNSNNVQDFKVRIPVRVDYEWGYIDTYVVVSVNKTLGTANKR